MDDDIHSTLYLLNVLFINYIIYLTAHTGVGWCQVPETKGDKNPVDNEGVVYRWRQLQGSVRAVWLQWPGHGDADMKLHLANLLHLVSSLLILRLGYIKLINILSLQR